VARTGKPANQSVDINTGMLRRDRVLVQNTPGAVLFLGFGPQSQWRRRLAIANELAKSYDPDEPRDAHGRWTSEGGATADASAKPATGRTDPNQAKKERFVDAHLADAQKAADKLGVPVENILGLSALESKWGEHRFAAQGNNYFGIQYPAPFATSFMLNEDGKTKVATFASYADGLRSFIAESGSVVQGISNPAEFAAALQNSGKYGINRDGSKVPTYVPNTALTIQGLRAIISPGHI
jgi:Mannosyl-glycoprotein endo-beta-N-acetylglucosaminidase